MERVFKKNFLYSVDCYEVWQNQKCMDQDDIEGEIYGISYGDTMFFGFMGLEQIGFSKPIYVNLSSPYSQIFKTEETSIINEDRIQYFKDDFEFMDSPYLCHLFCKFGRISYVRFATPNKESSYMFPVADKLYEFYGDMVELGSFSNTSKKNIDNLCTQMVLTAKSNNYNIIIEKSYNSGMVWNNMCEVYKQELQIVAARLNDGSSNWETWVSYYAEQQIIGYYNSIGYVPKNTIDRICEDVFQAAKELEYNYSVESIEQLKFKVFFDLTNG